MILPVTIRVSASSTDSRQASGSNVKGSAPRIHPDFREELRKLSWRQAVIRVAEDQMYSEQGISSSAGNGVYDSKGIMWCGSFVYWCFEVVATAKGDPNPFGSNLGSDNPLRSGIKALDMGISNPAMFDVLNYEGSKQFGGIVGAIKPGDFRIRTAVPATASNIQRGDIVLPRRDRAIFEHVALVYDPPDASGAFTAINGNALGNYRPDGMKTPSSDIGISQHKDAFDKNTLQKDTVVESNGKSITMYGAGTTYYRHVFLHFKTFPS
jgi:hypothetical protein